MIFVEGSIKLPCWLVTNTFTLGFRTFLAVPHLHWAKPKFVNRHLIAYRFFRVQQHSWLDIIGYAGFGERLTVRSHCVCFRSCLTLSLKCVC